MGFYGSQGQLEEVVPRSGIRGQHPTEGAEGSCKWKKSHWHCSAGGNAKDSWREMRVQVGRDVGQRMQHQRQHQRRSQVQQQEALESAARESAGEGAPHEEDMGNCWQEVEVHTKGGVPHGWRRAHSLPPSLNHHSLEAQGEAKRGRDSDARLAAWRHKERQRRHKEKQRRQLEAAGVPAAEARQPEAAGEARQGDEVESAGAEEEDQPAAHHKV